MLRFIIMSMNLKKIKTTSNLEGKEQVSNNLKLVFVLVKTYSALRTCFGRYLF
jgi:hypothetical protein